MISDILFLAKKFTIDTTISSELVYTTALLLDELKLNKNLTYSFPNGEGESDIECVSLNSSLFYYSNVVSEKCDYDVAIIDANKLSGSVMYRSSSCITHCLLAVAAFSATKSMITNLIIDNDILMMTQFLRAIGISVVLGNTWVELEHTELFYRTISSTEEELILKLNDSCSALMMAQAICGTLGVASKYIINYERDITAAFMLDQLSVGGVKVTKTIGEITLSGRFHNEIVNLTDCIDNDVILSILVACYCARINVTILLPLERKVAPSVAVLIDILKKLKVKVVLQDRKILLFAADVDIVDKIILKNDSEKTSAACWLIANARGSTVNIVGYSPELYCRTDAYLVEQLDRFQHVKTPIKCNLKDNHESFFSLAAYFVGANLAATFELVDKSKYYEDTEGRHFVASLVGLGANMDISGNCCEARLHRNLSGITTGMEDARLIPIISMLAIGTSSTITIRNAHRVRKTYPTFFEDMVNLGAKLEIVNIKLPSKA